MGVALFPSDAKSAESLLQYADLAMYGAKHAGGGIRAARPLIERQRVLGTGRPRPSKAVV
jgi:predicted signal transduction protein with EAL and GGDEF domain